MFILVEDVLILEYLENVAPLRMPQERLIQPDGLSFYDCDNLIHWQMFFRRMDMCTAEDRYAELDDSTEKVTLKFVQWLKKIELEIKIEFPIVTFKAFDRLYSLPQYWHLYFLASECTTMCILRVLLVFNWRPQCGQI